MNVHEFLAQWKALRNEKEKIPILHITYVKRGFPFPFQKVMIR